MANIASFLRVAFDPSRKGLLGQRLNIGRGISHGAFPSRANPEP